MAAPALSPKPASVTAHAIIRYVQRVVGIDLPFVTEHEFGRGFAMSLYLYAAGLSRDEAAILTPLVRRAIDVGATRVGLAGMQWLIRNRTIVTLFEENPRPSRKHQVLTRREKHRISQRNSRKRTQKRVLA